jgi:hypothetical protein
MRRWLPSLKISQYWIEGTGRITLPLAVPARPMVIGETSLLVGAVITDRSNVDSLARSPLADHDAVEILERQESVRVGH